MFSFNYLERTFEPLDLWQSSFSVQSTTKTTTTKSFGHFKSKGGKERNYCLPCFEWPNNASKQTFAWVEHVHEKHFPCWLKMLAVSHDTKFEVTSCAGATGHAPNHVVSLIKIQELRRSHAVLAAHKNKEDNRLSTWFPPWLLSKLLLWDSFYPS